MAVPWPVRSSVPRFTGPGRPIGRGPRAVLERSPIWPALFLWFCPIGAETFRRGRRDRLEPAPNLGVHYRPRSSWTRRLRPVITHRRRRRRTPPPVVGGVGYSATPSPPQCRASTWWYLPPLVGTLVASSCPWGFSGKDPGGPASPLGTRAGHAAWCDPGRSAVVWTSSSSAEP